MTELKENQLQEFVAQLTKIQGRIRTFVVTLIPGGDIGDVLQETHLVDLPYQKFKKCQRRSS